MINLLLESSISERLREAILPEKIKLIGNFFVGPSMFSAFFVTAILLLIALCIRIFVIPKFSDKPNGLQIVIEGLIGYFDKLSNENARENSGFIGLYLFTAASYICIGTLVELLGIRPVLADLNACIALALMSFGQILIYNIYSKGPVKGTLLSLKDFSLPISFSFRLFGAILSGYMIMELVYSLLFLSFVLPAFLSVVFTLFHAFIQAYVFACLSSLFIGEATERSIKKPKKIKVN